MAKNFVFLLVLFPIMLMGQTLQREPDFLEAAVENAENLYQVQFPQSVILHTGPEYVYYDIGIKGHPYFFDEDFTTGSVVMKGQYFSGIPLLYDTYKDKLVLEHYNAFDYFEWLEIVPEKVDSFTVHGFRFFRVKDNREFSGQLDVGFYNLLHNGTVKVISKRNKTYYEEIKDRVVAKEFLQKDKFYIVKDGKVIQVRNKGSVMRAFKDKRKELKAAMRKEYIKFKPGFEAALIRVSQIYDNREADL